jgi:HlyD family secretion protein
LPHRLPLLLVVLAAAAAACHRGQAQAYQTQPVTRGPITEVVNATGDVSAIVTVNVGTQVSGTISKLYVDFNSAVKKDQLLALIDARLFEAQLERAKAALASAQADVENAQAAFNNAARVEQRTKELFDQRLVSQQDVDSAVAAREQAQAALSSAKAKVLQARADRDTAATNLVYTKITSPIDGIVVSRAVDVGQTVAASFQTPTLFTIANDLTKMQILANVDEADVGKVREGEDTIFTVDAYPGEEFHGPISQVRQAPNTIQNVVTYQAVIAAANPDHKLRQGMTAAVKILTSHRDDAIGVPNAALRWRPENAPPATDAGSGGSQAQKGDRTMARTAGARGGGSSTQDPAAGPQRPQGRPARVYKLQDGKPVPVNLRVGTSDGQRTEVLAGLDEGDQVIVGDSASGGAARPQAGRRGPF